MAIGRAPQVEYDPGDEWRPGPPEPPQIPAWTKEGGARVGIHCSIAGDIARSLELAKAAGANALQIFSASPRMWGNPSARISDAEAARFRERREALVLGPLAVHANYLINLASGNPVLRTRSVQAFHQELVRAAALRAEYVVLHPGSANNANREGMPVGNDRPASPGSAVSPAASTLPEGAIRAIAEGLRQAARGIRFGDMEILLENTAGQGAAIGARFAELRAILDACPELPLGICVDTAHLWATGWDVRSETGLERTIEEIAAQVGLDRLALVHVNDSKAARGSRLDRHQHIGEGKIGAEAFARILRHPALAGKPFIAETPLDKPGDDKRNVTKLWRLAKGAAPARKR